MKESNSLPSGCILRRANSGDRWKILKLVLGAKLEPTQLQIQQFWVIEWDGKIVACGQLRSFAGAQELGSLVVDRKWRDRGFGTFLTYHLIQQATQPLYLECMSRLMPFYQRCGFVPIPWQVLPKPLKIKFGLSQFAAKFVRLQITIMQYQIKA